MSRKQKRTRNAVKLPRSVKRLFPQVTQAIDSTEYAEVKVEGRDIKEGKKKDAVNCAMARAIKREYRADGAIIGLAYSYLIQGKTATRFKTPESVRREIVSFDRHQDFSTGEYILTPPSPTSRLGFYSGGIKSKDRKHEPKRKIHKTTGIRVLIKGASY